MIRTKQTFKNFELVAQWQHKKSGGNSGIFIWATDDGMKDLKPEDLPKTGIEVQALDHGYRELYMQKSDGKKADWFTTDGDAARVLGLSVRTMRNKIRQYATDGIDIPAHS